MRIFVTGSPRSGTSMMMQTLGLLGVKLNAKKTLKVHSPILEYNRKGFYDCEPEDFARMSDGAYKVFGIDLDLIPFKADKYIVMKRDRNENIKSYRKVHGLIGNPFTPEYIVDMCNEMTNEVDGLRVDFEKLRANPTEQIERITEYLGINHDITNAVKNIETCQHY